MPKQPKKKAKATKKERAPKPSPHPMKAVSKSTIRTFTEASCLKLARYYRERVGAELLSQKPRYNKALEMWEFDILKED